MVLRPHFLAAAENGVRPHLFALTLRISDALRAVFERRNHAPSTIPARCSSPRIGDAPRAVFERRNHAPSTISAASTIPPNRCARTLHCLASDWEPKGAEGAKQRLPPRGTSSSLLPQLPLLSS